MRFSDLLLPNSGLPLEKQQLEASKKFPERVMVSHLHFWSPGDPVYSEGFRLLMGVAASYALSELELLDLIDEGMSSRQEGIWVDVFDLAKCRTQSDIEKFFPGITKLVQTPILGIWSLGHLTEVVTGFYARERILKLVKGS